MGKSVAQFPVKGWAPEQVLAAATALGTQFGFGMENWGPNHILMAKGSEVLAGKRLVNVIAWSAPGGVNVTVQAWMSAGFEVNVSPHHLIKAFPRKETWSLASSIVARLGANPEAVFRHD